MLTKNKIKKILISIYAIFILSYAMITFTYAYFHDAKIITSPIEYESGNIEIEIYSVPESIDHILKLYGTPITKISDENYLGFNEDVIFFNITISNKSSFDVKSLIDLSFENGNLLYWIGINLESSNYRNLIIDDIGFDNTADLNQLENSLKIINSTKINTIKETSIAMNDSINITFVFWLEWQEELNLSFNQNFNLKITTIQSNGSFK